MSVKGENPESKKEESSFYSDFCDFIYSSTSQITDLFRFGEEEEPYSLNEDYKVSKELFDAYVKKTADKNKTSDFDIGFSLKTNGKCKDTALYDILQLSPTATKSEIKSSYRKLALLYHPDKSDDPDAKKKFQEIGEAYRILVDDISRQKYDKTGLKDDLNVGGDFDPHVFFIILFGCDLLDDFVGPLKIDSFIKNQGTFAFKSQANSYSKSSSDKETHDSLALNHGDLWTYLEIVQKYREARLAVLLRDRIQEVMDADKIPKSLIEFVRTSCQETYVDLLFTSIGWVYENCAESYMSEMESFLGLGATYTNLQSFGRNINNGYNIFKAGCSALSAMQQNKEIIDKMKDGKPPQDGREREATLKMMMESIEVIIDWMITMIIYDIESTLKEVCFKVCRDGDVDRETSMKRAHFMKKLGIKIQEIAQEVRDSKGGTKKEFFDIVQNAHVRMKKKSDSP